MSSPVRKHIYFCGIAGAAMASVASACRTFGYEVSGSDRNVYPPMSTFLDQQGIRYHNTYSSDHITDAIAESKKVAETSEILFVIGNALSRGNPEVEEILNQRAQYTSLASLTAMELISGNTSLVITGTHGKSTTAALAAWVLDEAGRKPGFLIGALPADFQTGCRHAGPAGIFVTEGDEYDTAFFDKRSKFLHYKPDIAVINNIEFDHADIFGSIEDVERSFRHFVRTVPGNGLLIVNGDDERALRVTRQDHTPVETFGIGAGNMWQARSIRFGHETSTFEVFRDGQHSGSYQSSLSGLFNVRNALAVIAASSAFGLDHEEISAGLKTFSGVKRRMETVAVINGIRIIDDFAHHPTAVRETVDALSVMYRESRIVALFEPRSNSSTRNIFQDHFTAAFISADVVMIGPVNRSDRYGPDEILSTERLVEDIRQDGTPAHCFDNFEKLLEHIMSTVLPGDVLVFMSNGGFGGIPGRVVDRLRSRFPDNES